MLVDVLGSNDNKVHPLSIFETHFKFKILYPNFYFSCLGHLTSVVFVDVFFHFKI